MHSRIGRRRPALNPLPRRLASCTSIAAAALALGSCANFDRIDTEITRLVHERATAMGGSAMTPRLASPDIPDYDPDRIYETDLETVNPDAAELGIQPADPARDVSERLEQVYVSPANALEIDLESTYRIAQRTAREFISAEEDYVLSAISLLIERHDWNPRFFNTVSADLDFDPDDGAGNDTAALNVINDLRVTQRLPYGGSFEAGVITRVTQQLTELVGDQSDSSSELRLSLNVPLLRDAGPIARESLIQAERDLIYAARDFERFRRQFLVSIASDYFSLVAQQASLRNAEARLASVQILLDQTEAFVDAGRTSPFELQNVRQNLLSSRASLINQRESFQLAKDRFKIRLGLPVTTPIRIASSELNVLEPQVDLVDAARKALTLRLDYQSNRDQIDDARRAVANSQNQLLPDLDLNLSAGFATDDKLPDIVSFDEDGQSYSAGVTFGLPLDRKIQRLQLRRSVITLQRAIRNLEAFRDNLVLDARAAVRELDRARLTVELQSESVAANRLRQRELFLKRDEVTAQDRLDAENELLSTLNGLDSAIRDLNIAVLDYLLTTGQMRVSREGVFQPPPALISLEQGLGEEAETEPEPLDPDGIVPGEPNPDAGEPEPGLDDPGNG